MLNFYKAELVDAEAIAKLINTAYRGETSRKGWTTEADLLDGQRADFDGILESLEKKNCYFILAQNSKPDPSDPRVFGSVFIEIKKDCLYFGMLTVHPNFQGLGLGKWFLKQVENEAIRWDRKKVQMTVIGQRHELISWYQRHGFKTTGQRLPFPYGDCRFGIPKRNDLYFEILEKDL